MNSIIINDIHNLISFLFNNYNLSKNNLDFYLKRYSPNISIENNFRKKNKLIKKKKKYNHYIPHTSQRCIARIWGKPPYVSYDMSNKKWIYGTRCSRYKHKNRLCLTHYKQSISKYGLTHGSFFNEPPHLHYLKYKNKIKKKFKIKL